MGRVQLPCYKKSAPHFNKTEEKPLFVSMSPLNQLDPSGPDTSLVTFSELFRCISKPSASVIVIKKHLVVIF